MADAVQACKLIEKDVDSILSLYDYAEKLYPYSKVHNNESLNENDQRLNMTRFHCHDNPTVLLTQGSPLPMLFVYLMSRAGSSGLLDFSTIYKSPLRAFGWLMLGNSILMFHKMQYLKEKR